MATLEPLSVECDPLAPSFDEDLNAVEREENQVVAGDTRELSPYTFDSDDKTLLGIGSSDSANSSTLRHFDSSDRTLVGIGPAELAERAERAKRAESASHSPQARPALEDVPLPNSEPPGPFVASDDDDDAPDRLPMQKGELWMLALSAVLVAAAGAALLREVVPHWTAPRLHAATTVAPLPTADEPRTNYAQFETAAATSTETFAVEIPITQAPEALEPAAPPAAAPGEKQPELAPRRASAKSAARELLGALDVTSNPPSGLVLDGRPLGQAPRVIQVPSGPHTVLFVHPERGRMSITVNVRPGRTTRASANF